MAVLIANGAAVRRAARAVRVATAVLAGLLFVGPGAAIDGTQPENRVKAAFLYNFVRFIEWPRGAVEHEDPLIIAVLFDDDFVDDVHRTVDGKTVAGRHIEVRSFANLAGIEACDVVFVGEAGASEIDSILALLVGQPVLTVSEVNDFAERGGVIGLYRTENKLRFRINVAAARNAGLEISSKLLGLSDVVHGPVPGG
jgi:hypothetical protein